jgi:hypothetical protein
MKGAEQTFRVELMVLGFGERLASAQSHPHIAVSDTAGTNGQLLRTDKCPGQVSPRRQPTTRSVTTQRWSTPAMRMAMARSRSG